MSDSPDNDLDKYHRSDCQTPGCSGACMDVLQDQQDPEEEEWLPKLSVEKPPEITMIGAPVPKKMLSAEQVAASRAQALLGDVPKGRASVSLRHRAICHMAALGIKTNAIAQSMSLSAARVSAIINSDAGREAVKEIQTQYFTHEPAAVFRAMAPRAANVIHDVMDDSAEKGATRIQAAGMILDRAYGKPSQEIKHEGSVLKDLFKQLDNEKKADAAKVIDAEVVVDETTKWVEENL